MKQTESVEATPLAPGLSAKGLAATEGKVLHAYRAAISAGEQHKEARAVYAFRSIAAGFGFLEFRGVLGQNRVSERMHRSGAAYLLRGRNEHSQGQGWRAWLAEHDIPETTARRWMLGAVAVGRQVLGLAEADPWPRGLNDSSGTIAFSDALLLDESALPARAVSFREAVQQFLGDRTLAEAVRSVADGESEHSRITRAANGRADGGAPDTTHDPDARKNFALFGMRALAVALGHIGAAVDKKGGHWQALKPVERHTVLNGLDLFVAGLPDEVVEHLADRAAHERRDRKRGAQPRPLALKAVVSKTEGAKAIERFKTRR